MDLVTERKRDGKTVYLCDCGLGYGDILIAYACEEYRRVHGINSEDIIKLAIYNPRTEVGTEAIPTNRPNPRIP